MIQSAGAAPVSAAPTQPDASMLERIKNSPLANKPGIRERINAAEKAAAEAEAAGSTLGQAKNFGKELGEFSGVTPTARKLAAGIAPAVVPQEELPDVVEKLAGGVDTPQPGVAGELLETALDLPLISLGLSKSIAGMASKQIPKLSGTAAKLLERELETFLPDALKRVMDINISAPIKEGIDVAGEKLGQLADKFGGVTQKGKELVERVPRALGRAKEGIEEAAIKSEKIRKATPAVKEAIKSNLDERVINSVQEADADTLKGYKEMLDISSNPNKTLGAKVRPEIVAGRAAESQYKVIDKQRKIVGKQIGDAVDELSKTVKVKMEDGYKAIDDVLRGEGITSVIDEKGSYLDFSGSRFTPAERTRIKELYSLARESGDQMTPSQVYKKDNLFSKLQREAKFEGIGDIIVSTPDGDKSLFKVFREIFSKKLDDVSPTDIRDLNKQYAKLRGLQDDIEDSIVKTGSYDASKATDLAEFAQTNLRRLGSDAQSAAAYREIASKMDVIAREFGYEGAKPETLIDFANEMRRLFPDVVPANSLPGSIKTSIAGMAEKVLDAGIPNLSDQQKALIKMVEELMASGALK